MKEKPRWRKNRGGGKPEVEEGETEVKKVRGGIPEGGFFFF